MQRREFLGVLGGAAMWPLAAHAQQPAAKVWRVGVLSPGLPGQSPPLEIFRTSLRDLGYVEGRNLIIDWKFSEEHNDPLPALANELVRANVDIIFAINTPAALAAKNATTSIPIVVTRVSDPIRTGLIASLAKPGGNLTGLTTISEELEGKRLELLREALPGLLRVAVLWNEANSGHALNVREMERAGPPLGLQVYLLGLKRADELPAVLQTAIKVQAGALFVIDDLVISSFQTRILDFASKNKLPVISQFREFTDAGGLMAYGPGNDEMFRRAAVYIDKILKGGKPSDIPVERPTRFNLIINLKAAKSLGLTVPPTFIARADEVIE
jgi:putative tryptophan/tyrosine transport system substrate-binding protein